MPRQNVLVGIVSYFPCVVAIAAVPWFNIPPILLLLHSMCTTVEGYHFITILPGLANY